ncbi:MAG TPA: DUF1579 domain-containing protein [Caulobacteraceae bacterium]|jgi:hypothetical protein|nr:DUF1579 domain-containing protein [Caulobacteraceae bacterium]
MQGLLKSLSHRSGLAEGPALAGAASAMAMDNGPRGEFGFLVGDWRVKHRKLKRRLAGETGWWEFEGFCRSWTALDGAGSFDDNFLDEPTGSYRAVTFRRRDPRTHQWAIWWFDQRVPGSNIDPPVAGSFKDGVGTFLTADTFEGKPILVRFLWSDIAANSATWAQAFSPDRGGSWETNWVMQFERVA